MLKYQPRDNYSYLIKLTEVPDEELEAKEDTGVVEPYRTSSQLEDEYHQE